MSNEKRLMVEFQIHDQVDRRALIGVLADNGYRVRVEQRGKFPNEQSFVVVEADEPVL